MATYSPIFSMLLGQLPTLLTYAIGLALCIAWRRRCPRAATLALVGTLLLVFASVTFPIVQLYVFTTQNNAGAAGMGQMLAVLSVLSSLVRGAGFILLVAAVFSERARVDGPVGFPMVTPSTPVRL